VWIELHSRYTLKHHLFRLSRLRPRRQGQMWRATTGYTGTTGRGIVLPRGSSVGLHCRDYIPPTARTVIGHRGGRKTACGIDKTRVEIVNWHTGG
jgi:hypothetical protein